MRLRRLLVRGLQNLRPSVVIADVLASYKLMKALNPEVVITGHGPPTTAKVFDEYEQFYTLLLNESARWWHRTGLSVRFRENLKCLSTPTGLGRTV